VGFGLLLHSPLPARSIKSFHRCNQKQTLFQPGHQLGNREVPGLIPGWDLSTAVVSLGKKLYPHCLSHTQLLNSDTLCVLFRAQLKNSLLADAAFPVRITEEKKERNHAKPLCFYRIVNKRL